MPHHLAQEHMGMVEALCYGTARTQATIAAALAGIGGAPAILSLTKTGDGVWTIGSNTTIPTNVTLQIPSGVTVNRSAGVTLTINGPLVAWQSAWESGAGTTIRSVQQSVEHSAVLARQLTVQNPTAGQGMNLLSGVSGNNKQILSTLDSGGGNPGWLISADNTNNNAGWIINVAPAGGQLTWARPSATHFMMLNASGLGIGAGTVPTGLLQLGADSAIKPGTTTWQNPSDARLKDILGDYTQGVAFLRTFPQPKLYRYNGKGGTPTDGQEYVTFIAQELQPVAPEWVSSYQGTLDPEDPEPTEILTVNLGVLIFVLVNAVRELDARLQSLETLAGTMEPRVTDLETAAHGHEGQGSAAGVSPYTPTQQAVSPPAPTARAASRRHRRIRPPQQD